MVLALDAPAGAEDRRDPVEWVPVATLSDIVAYGLARPSRAFVCTLHPRGTTFMYAYLAFTLDDRLVLGLSLDDDGARPVVQAQAERVMHELMAEFDGYRGIVGVEFPPPLSEASFAAAGGSLITAKVDLRPGSSERNDSA